MSERTASLETYIGVLEDLLTVEIRKSARLEAVLRQREAADAADTAEANLDTATDERAGAVNRPVDEAVRAD